MTPKKHKVEDIIKAFKNSYSKDPIKDKLAKDRLKVCKGCDFYYSLLGICNPLKCKDVNGKEVCGCGCIIKKKVYSDDKNSCPQLKWEE